MNRRTLSLFILNLVVFCAGVGGAAYLRHHPAAPALELPAFDGPFDTKPEIVAPIKVAITKPQPSYMTYQQTVAQLKQWAQEAPELAEVGVYGRSTRGTDLYYIRLRNKRLVAAEQPRLLVTACIHGNEPLASSTTMWHVGALLSRYGKDDAVTQVVDSRDMYFVPVASPDSYPSSRAVDGVDPNRNFSDPSRFRKPVAPVAALMDLFNKVKPNAVVSGHTWGRVYLTPYGDVGQNCPDHEAMMQVMRRCQELSGYRCMRAFDMYERGGGLNNPPIRVVNEGEPVAAIYGTEVDWYYRHGAFAIVCEFGTHQRIPTDEDTRVEFSKTFAAFLHFAREAPLVVRPK
jgi:hypothetical protein